MIESQDAWYENIEIAGIGIRRVSKFSRKEFTVELADIESRWDSWTEEERNHFAAAFACSPQDRADDRGQRMVSFLMERGDPGIWRKIALLIAKYTNCDRAVGFLLARVREGVPPLANYYQALALLSPPECVPTLVEALFRHRREVDLHPTLQDWKDKFLYMDYLSCSATLFKITGREEYRTGMRETLKHPAETVRNMVGVVASSTGISL